MIHRVPADLVKALWPAIDPHVVAAMEFHPFLEALDIQALLFQGLGQLFVVVGPERRVQGFAVMEVVQYPRRKVANVLASGGDNGFLGTAIHELLPKLKEWGREQGADALSITGRPGWFKALQDEGGDAEKLVMWWTRLGDVQGRRQLQESAADGSLRAVETGSTLPH